MTPRKAPSDEQIRDAFTEVGEALQRAVVLSSDRVQSVFEDAVIRGRMTRRDAEDLASSLVALGRDQAQELRGEVDALARSLPGRVVDASADAARLVRKGSPTSKPGPAKARRINGSKAANGSQAANGAKPANGSKTAHANGAVPADVAGRPAKELIALTGSLTVSDLRALRTQEEAGKQRATVLRAIDAKLQG